MQTDLFMFIGRNLTLLDCALLTTAVVTAGCEIKYRNIRRNERNERKKYMV